MPEKEPQFTVTDRRKFTLEGELREGESSSREAESDERSHAERAAASPAPPETQGQRPEPQNERSHEEQEGAIPAPTAAESAAQSKDYHASSHQLDELVGQAGGGNPSALRMNFERLVQSIYMSAAVQMGADTQPGEQPRVDILGARQSIDMLGVLEEKTRGNLTEDEKRLLQTALFDLRMSFLEITNAITKSAKQPPNPKAVR